ncbi:lipopolysaccharide biosynthesis protein [Clostridium perfringens]|uniref:lipopolysaccharide biosynthesis protein n=1 Tax=Clostridium perfringens TaxID=1502 RepID=UPI002ACE53B5|nr:lipopolysaccharide biosynthesis protein [Clostridium perfringens]MDZ7545995.1 oligosaccharide flippase family protein [Clostridium perfringens]
MKKLIYKIKNNKIANNFIVLLTGEGIVSLIGMLSMAIIIKAIGLEFNGMIISIQTYCLLINNIFGFKSFQALIKYLSKCIDDKNYVEAESYIYQSYILDIVAAIIATLFSFLLVRLYANYMEWDNKLIFYSYFFIFASFFQIQGTPVGILRTFNKFNFITYNNVTMSIVKFSFYIIGFITSSSLKYYIIVEVVLFILPNIILNWFAFRTLKENNLDKFYKKKLKFNKDFFEFNFYSNISSTIDLPVGTLTTVLINKYLGYTDISIYKIFEKLGGMIGKLGAPLNQIIYPEMSLHIARKDYKKAKRINDKLIVYISILGIVIISGVCFTYKFWLWMFIPNYEDYIISLVFYFIFIIFINATSGIHSLFIALDYIKYNIPILLTINTIYLAILYWLIINLGLNGVILALFLQAIAVVVIKFTIIVKNNYLERKRYKH